MSFDWRYGIGTVVALWLGGAAFSGLFMFFFGPRSKNENLRKEWRGRLAASIGLSFFLWPFLLPSAVCIFLFHHSIRAGKRPAWLVYADNEISVAQWTLSDGTEFLGSAYGGSSRKECHFLADYMSERVSGQIQFRVRMSAPNAEPFTEWQQLVFTAQPSVAEDDENSDDNSSKRYEGVLRLPRGKYAVEFRAQDSSGVFEERSGLTMIVADDKDYE